MSTKGIHTPGPWQILTMDKNDFIRVRGARMGTRFEIANILLPTYQNPSQFDINECQANARLIAAAPYLLQDLIAAAAQLRYYEAQHRAKRTQESTEKADVNALLADRFEKTIKAATEVPA